MDERDSVLYGRGSRSPIFVLFSFSLRVSLTSTITLMLCEQEPSFRPSEIFHCVTRNACMHGLGVFLCFLIYEMRVRRRDGVWGWLVLALYLFSGVRFGGC